MKRGVRDRSLLGSFCLLVCLGAQAQPARSVTLSVAAGGGADYTSIQRAVDAAPAEGAVISIAPGTYREVVHVRKPNLVLRGTNPDPAQTVIVFNHASATVGSTFFSATVEVAADDFRAENLTFANDYNATHPDQPQSQALALSVTGDRDIFRNLRFLGNQDTVYAGSKGCSPPTGKPCAVARQYFSDCYIEGNVDFIFGTAKAVFENCELHSNPRSGGYVTAQGRNSPELDSGFVFNHCRLTADPGVDGVWLGRPWRPYATVIFLNTEMGAHLQPAGWREWHPGETHSLETAFYAEYNSSGPGATMQQRDPHTRKLTASEAERFQTRRFLAGADGWDPTAAH